MRKLVIVSLVLLGALASTASAGAASLFYVKEVQQGGAVRNWGDRQGHPFTSCSNSLAVHEVSFIRSASAGTSTVTCEAYPAGLVLRAFNLDR